MSYIFRRRHEAHAAGPGRAHGGSVRGEQVRMLYEGLWQPILASIVGALLLVMSFWNSVPHAVLTGWLAGLLVVSLLRLMLSERFQRQTPEAQLRPRWLNAFAGGALLAGLAWGLAGWLLFSPSYDEYQAVLAIILAGIGAGSVTTLSSVWGVAALFLIPAILPLTMRYLAVGTPVSLVLAVMMGLFLGLTLVVSRRFSLIITENIALRIEGAGREAALRESESRYRSIFRSAPLGILHFDRQGRVLDCNDRFEQIIGARRECMLGLDMCRDLPDRQVGQAVEQALADGYGYYEGEYISVSSGRTIPLRAFFNGVRGADDEIIGGVAAIEDFTERKRAEALIHRQAFYDPLTDLPNRRLLIERLESAQQACRQTRTQGVVLFLDLDRFKSVNDSLGHAMGDRLLCETARRLSSLLRRGDMAARLSGDEFVILAAGLPECPDRAQQAASALAGRFLEALSAPYAIAGRTVRVTPSIGFALFPREAENVTDLLKYADTAMYQAKALGRARVCGYQPSMQDAVERRLSLESDLRHAIETDRLQLHYQPQVESDGRIMGVEALLRWPHETHGFISPGEFIPLAEESGLIADLGDWVLGEACRCLQRFDAGCLPRLSVNISPRHFAQSDFVERIQATVVDFGVAPERLLLELTEGVLIDHLQDAIAKMQALKRIGVGLAIDDFGTGYSSLSYLKRLPLDELKIDRSFVQDLDDDADAAIVQAIIAVSRHLQLSVVAEGVETTAQLERLQASGCRLFQGYYFHRPMPAEALAQVLAAQYSPH